MARSRTTLAFRNGEIEVHALTDDVRPARTASEMFPEADRALVDRHRDWLAQGLMDPHDDRLILGYRSWLIRTAELTILFDLSVGEDKTHPSRPDLHQVKSGWFNDLGLAGASPADIDLVVLSHLHLDHIGWLTRRHGDQWRPTFPEAKHLVSPIELEHWSEHHRDYPWMGESYAESIAPVREAGLFELVSPGHRIAEGITLIPLAGHTPGMLGLQIDSGQQRLLFVGDLIHHPVQVREPHLSSVFCDEPRAAVAARAEFLGHHADTNDLIFPAHFPNGFGTIVRCDDGYDFLTHDPR